MWLFLTIIMDRNTKFCLIYAMFDFYDQMIIISFKSSPDIFTWVCSDGKWIVFIRGFEGKESLLVYDNISALPIAQILGFFVENAFVMRIWNIHRELFVLFVGMFFKIKAYISQFTTDNFTKPDILKRESKLKMFNFSCK